MGGHQRDLILGECHATHLTGLELAGIVLVEKLLGPFHLIRREGRDASDQGQVLKAKIRGHSSAADAKQHQENEDPEGPEDP